jgi:hypothetical protein
MCQHLLISKVICIKLMLIDKIAPRTIADTLKVLAKAVYYYKQRLDQLSLVPANAVAAVVGCKRAFRPSINKVL